MLHVSVSYCSSKIPVVYGLPKSRNSHFFHGCACNLSLEEMIHLCTVKNTHYPLLFVDSITTKDLPSAEVLAMFKIVVTSSQRFSLEWKHGSMTRELPDIKWTILLLSMSTKTPSPPFPILYAVLYSRYTGYVSLSMKGIQWVGVPAM